MKARIIRREQTIRELPDGRWLNKHTGRYYKTFTGAQAATRREAKATVRNLPNGILVQAITWEPTTRTGRILVNSLK